MFRSFSELIEIIQRNPQVGLVKYLDNQFVSSFFQTERLKTDNDSGYKYSTTGF